MTTCHHLELMEPIRTAVVRVDARMHEAEHAHGDIAALDAALREIRKAMAALDILQSLVLIQISEEGAHHV